MTLPRRAIKTLMAANARALLGPGTRRRPGRTFAFSSSAQLSARVIELAGALAIASTSAGVSWSHGRSDGQKLQREEMIQAIRYMVETVALPVTADIEGGDGSGSTEDVAETVKALVAIGAVGINLEDSPGRDGEALLAPETHGERIAAAREAARAAVGDLVINARTDVYQGTYGASDDSLPFGEVNGMFARA